MSLKLLPPTRDWLLLTKQRLMPAAEQSTGCAEAVPKRILDLMNVEGLTRENVASHLQVRPCCIPLSLLPLVLECQPRAVCRN